MRFNFSQRQWTFIGAAYGLGSSRSGTAYGPQAILDAGLIDRLERIGVSANFGHITKPYFKSTSEVEPKLRHITEFLDFHKQLKQAAMSVYTGGARPLIVGGDHALSISSISTASEFLKQTNGKSAELGVIWIDGHPDINTPETSPSGNIHGMPMAVLMGIGDERLTSLIPDRPAIKSSNLVYIGLRDVDIGEKKLISDLNIKAYTMRDIDQNGIAKVVEDAFSYLQSKTDAVVVSFDLDVCDPNIAPGVGSPISGGLTEREAHYIMESVAMAPNIISIELVEFNPELDLQEKNLQGKNLQGKNLQGKTLELSLRLLESALGNTIL